MPRKVRIVAELMLENSDIPINLIEEKIRNETKIPWCTSIDKIVIDDISDYCESLQKKGVSDHIIRNLMQHFYRE